MNTARRQDDGGSQLLLGGEIRPEEMDQWRRSAAAPSGSDREASRGSGDEAADGIGGDRRVSRGAELRRAPPRPPRLPRRPPPARRRAFAPLIRCQHTDLAQEGAAISVLYV